MKTSEQKEHEWKLKRLGKITSSVLPDLMTSGRAKDDLFGVKALNVLYITRYERRNKTLREELSAKALEWGKDNEPLALQWLRTQLPFNEIKSCSGDFEDIVFNEPFEGFGDSPDAYVYDPSGNVIALVEVKCPISQSKIEELQFLQSIDEKNEYYEQFIGHFIGRPDVDKLYYVIFDGYQNTGRLLEMNRADHLEAIQKQTERIRISHETVNESLRSGRDFKACIDDARIVLDLKLKIEELKPLTKGNVPVYNECRKLKTKLKLLTKKKK